MSFIFTSTRDPRHHHSFPTRRSSDLSDRVLASWRLAAKVDPDTPAFEIPVEDRPTTAVLVRTRAQIPALENALRSRGLPVEVDRKSTRLNSSHMSISYAVFCLKKKRT